MKIESIAGNFSVCIVFDYDNIDLLDKYTFIGKTDEENSLVCLSETVPANVIERDDGLKGMRIQGELDFSLIGILAQIATALAKNKISIFVVSTFNTDYIFVKEADFTKALLVQASEGYELI